jgi:hypothetical protein
MNTYTWITTNLYTIDVNTETNYVVTAVYDVIGTDGTYSASLTNVGQFAVNQNQPNYVPYSDLTNDIVIGWVQEELGVDGVNSIESSIDGQINSQANPPLAPQNTPLPF